MSLLPSSCYLHGPLPLFPWARPSHSYPFSPTKPYSGTSVGGRFSHLHYGSRPSTPALGYPPRFGWERKRAFIPLLSATSVTLSPTFPPFFPSLAGVRSISLVRPSLRSTGSCFCSTAASWVN